MKLGRNFQLAALIFGCSFFFNLMSNLEPVSGQDLNGDDLFLDGGATNQPDIFFNENTFRHSICMRSNFLRFILENDDETSNRTVFELNNDAPSRALGAFENGVAIGTSTPTAPLHVFSSGSTTSGYADARILVENTDVAALREMVRLENNGGVGLRMVDNSTGTFFKMENVIDRFELASGPVHVRVRKDSSNNSLNLATDGIGIGLPDPESTLHIQADLDDALQNTFLSSTIRAETKGGGAPTSRVQLACINNGPSIIALTDTSRPTMSQWLMTNTTFPNGIEALSLRKNAGGAPNFTIFEDGNIRFTFNGSPNCTIQPNGNLFIRGTLQSNSDRNLKENIAPVDAEEILAKVVEMPISTWNYNYDENDIPHMGPMAQDFYQAFGLGVDEKTIASTDKDGVALAAIQGLNKKVEAKSEKIARLTQDLNHQSQVIADQAELIDELTERLNRLESLVTPARQ